MGKRIVRAVLVTLATASFGIPGAEAGKICGSYSVAAPVIGTSSNTFCQQTPPAFDFPVSAQNCRGVPPAGFTLCLGASADLPHP